jgi:hypothetical protein
MSFQSDKRIEGCRGRTGNSIDDIYNDPILSDILRRGPNTSNDSEMFNSDSMLFFMVWIRVEIVCFFSSWVMGISIGDIFFEG